MDVEELKRYGTGELPTNWIHHKDLKYRFECLFKYRPWTTFCQYIRRRSYKPDVLGRTLLYIRNFLKR